MSTTAYVMKKLFTCSGKVILKKFWTTYSYLGPSYYLKLNAMVLKFKYSNPVKQVTVKSLKMVKVPITHFTSHVSTQTVPKKVLLLCLYGPICVFQFETFQQSSQQ